MEVSKPEPAVTSSPSTNMRNSMMGRLILTCIIVAALALNIGGIQRNLPIFPEIDEPTFVLPAVNIAATGDLNPGWFGHPGSTVIYPLAGVYHIWNTLVHGGTLFRPDPSLLTTFQSNESEFYLLGRILTIFYGVMTIPLVYLIGRRVFGQRVGLIGSGLFMLYPIAVTHAQMVRTDSVGTFFGMLGLWMCLRLYDRPTAGNQILAGLAIGLAISSRYFMVTLIPVLVVVDVLILWRQISHRQVRIATWLGAAAGLSAVAVTFAATTPYFLLDFQAAWAGAMHEGRSGHLGADGLSHTENFVWYLTDAIPLTITWAQTILATLGVGLVVWSRQPRQMLVLLFAVTFLVGISRAGLHWQRWIIPILPLLALLTAHALSVIIGRVSARLRLVPVAQRGLILLTVLLISAWPAYNLVLQDIRQATPSTRIVAREWILRNLPAGSRIVTESHTVPPDTGSFMISQQFSIARNPMESYLDDGYQYAIVSSRLYDDYFAEPDRYAGAVAYYETLFAEGRLLQGFKPSYFRGGPVITIYEIEEP